MLLPFYLWLLISSFPHHPECQHKCSGGGMVNWLEKYSQVKIIHGVVMVMFRSYFNLNLFQSQIPLKVKWVARAELAGPTAFGSGIDMPHKKIATLNVAVNFYLFFLNSKFSESSLSHCRYALISRLASLDIQNICHFGIQALLELHSKYFFAFCCHH